MQPKSHSSGIKQVQGEGSLRVGYLPNTLELQEERRLFFKFTGCTICPMTMSQFLIFKSAHKITEV